MVPNSRDAFREYCLRALGAPVVQINVEEQQIEDRIDESLYVFQQFHMDAVEKVYLKHEVTASTLTLTNAVGTFLATEQFRGSTSNAVGTVFRVATPLEYSTSLGTFVVGETITGTHSGATGVIATIVPGDMDNKYIPIPDSIIGVNRVFPPYDGRISAEILFDPQAQFNISLLSNFTSNSIIPYVAGRQYQQLLNDTFRGRPGVRFQRHMNRLYVDVNWETTFRPGQFIIIECAKIIDPDFYTAVWSDRWLQRYAIALLKRQWGQNLSKYTGVSLPGGVSLDGKAMYAEAHQEVRDLEAELESKFTLPPDFIVGGITALVGLSNWLNSHVWTMLPSIIG